MNLTQEKALFHLIGKQELSQVKTGVLQTLTDECPYFAPAHFFLTARLKQQNQQKDWVSEAVKTNLYFTNPYWLQLQLNDHLPSVAVGATESTPIQKTENAERIAIPTVEAVREMMRKIDHSQETTSEAEEPLPDEYVEENEAMIDDTGAENKIAGILSSQLADFKKPVEPDAVLDIDADKKRLHTVDYFASQGIKIDLSAIPQDKLTAHLRKFTDWLKQVKHTTQTGPNDLGTNPEMEKAVAENAKNSNETREILTETMADVLIKQGQTDKAIQLYIKLSFLNPEKSSYFAAKIEQLKGI